MPLVLDQTYSTGTTQTGTSGSLAIQVPSTDQRALVVAVASNYTAALGANLTSAKYANFPLTQLVQSTGVEILYLRNPAYTPGISTRNIELAFGGSQIFGIAAFLCSIIPSGFPFGSLGLDGNVTGNPEFSSDFSLTDQEILFSCVKIEQNTLLPNQVTSTMNITSGSGASLITYAAGYYQASGSESVDAGWTRQGTPVNDTWGLCARVLNVGVKNPTVVNG